MVKEKKAAKKGKGHGALVGGSIDGGEQDGGAGREDGGVQVLSGQKLTMKILD